MKNYQQLRASINRDSLDQLSASALKIIDCELAIYELVNTILIVATQLCGPQHSHKSVTDFRLYSIPYSGLVRVLYVLLALCTMSDLNLACNSMA